MMPGILLRYRQALLALIVVAFWTGISDVDAQEEPAVTDAAPAVPAQADKPLDPAVKARLQAAETLYRFSLSEGGDLPAIRRAQSMLPNVSVSELSPEDKTLLNDVKIESEIMQYRLIGMFPLTRFVTATPFSANTVRARYELLEQPQLTAVAEARNRLLQDPLLAGQYDVLVVSTGKDQNLNQKIEERFHSELALTRRFFPVTGRKTDEVDVQLKDFADGTLSSLPSSLAGIRPFLLVLVQEKCVQQDYFHYEVNGYLFNDPRQEPAKFAPIVQEGFSVKRNDVMWSVLVLTVLLLAAAPFLYRGLVRLTAHTRRAPTWGNSFLMGTLGFVFGLAFIWGIAPMVARTRPGELLPAWTSFWWPAVVGAAYILGPATVFHFAEGRFKWLGASFETFNRGGAIFAIIALGSATYLAQTSLHYAGWSAWWIVPPLLIASSLSALVVGRAMDKTEGVPLWVGAAAAFVTLLIGLAWCRGNAVAILDPLLVWLTLIPAIGVLLVSVGHLKVKTAAADPVDTQQQSAPQGALSCQWLVHQAYAPPFQESDVFKRSTRMLEPWLQGKTVRMALIGPAGIGKSATLRAIQKHIAINSADVAVLRGVCAETPAGAVPTPYAPFVEAIAAHFSVNLLAPQKDEIKHIDAALGGIFDSVVPFAGLLFPPTAQGQTGSKTELFVSIAAMIRQLARRRPVLLMLDDVHWMDVASQELLAFLLGDFPAGGDCSLAVLVAGRPDCSFFASGAQLEQLALQPLSKNELQAILVTSMHIQRETAIDLLNAVGGEHDNLFWLFQIIAHVAQQELFVWENGCFCWKPEAGKITDHLPNTYRDSVAALVNAHPEFVAVLRCAACVGLEFTVEQVSQGVAMTRLELLELLERIEKETEIVQDVLYKDDCFQFRSPFMLEALRDILSVNAEGPLTPITPQQTREFHFRLARAMESTLDESNASIFDVANHYYAGGSRCAEKALHYSIRAAHAASAQFQHDVAREYVERAKECAAAGGIRDQDFERELLLLECREAHVEGKNRVVMARRAQEFLDQHPQSDFAVYLATVQACYDAGIDTRDQKHFADCVRIAQIVLERFQDALQQAEAHQFWAIGLSPAEADQRREHLQTAMSLIGTPADDDLDALRLKARVANSLGEQLSYGSDEDRVQARQWFELSIALKQREDIRDLEGLAVAHGGMGRLFFFAKPPDYDTARKHFAEDLRYSEKIGSLTGQAKMYSFLGACDLQQGNRLASALKHYESAYDLAEERYDKFFGLAGLLECHGALERIESAERDGTLLLELVRAGLDALPEEVRNENPIYAIPRDCQANISAALKKCAACQQSPWHRWLDELLTHNRVAATS